MGKLSFDSNGYGGVGYAANDDILPTAYEEIWTGTSASGVSVLEVTTHWLCCSYGP